jgi:hypothetical protein
VVRIIAPNHFPPIPSDPLTTAPDDMPLIIGLLNFLGVSGHRWQTFKAFLRYIHHKMIMGCAPVLKLQRPEHATALTSETLCKGIKMVFTFPAIMRPDGRISQAYPQQNPAIVERFKVASSKRQSPCAISGETLDLRTL